MKTKLLVNILLLLFCIGYFSACQSKPSVDKKYEHPPNRTTVTFIGNFDKADTEVVIKKMVRHSVSEQDYYILKNKDTLQFATKGQAFYGVGIRNRVLDSLVINQGDIVMVQVLEDTLNILVDSSDLSSNLNWMADFNNKVEQHLDEALKDLIVIPPNVEELRKPLVFTNDFEILQFTMANPYSIDKDKYNLNKAYYDKSLQEVYFNIDSVIANSRIDKGAQEIARNYLFNATIDKFRRIGSTLQPWLYEHLLDKLNNNCNYQLTTDIYDFFINHLTDKNFNRITYDDLTKAYHKITDISCVEHRSELYKSCLVRMLIDGNKLKKSKGLLKEYVEASNDSLFYNYINSKFSLEQATSNGRDTKSVLVDINNQNLFYEDVLEAHKGNVLLVDFWASWCKPCRKAMPDVKSLKERFKNQDFEVVYMSIDKYPNPWKRASKDENIWNPNTYWVSNWGASEVRKKFNIQHIPRYILYDKTGKVAYQKAPKPDALDEIIEKLIKD